MKHTLLILLVVSTLMFASLSCQFPQSDSSDKTLVSWVELHDIRVDHGSILTIQQGQQFDGIVLGEIEAGKWIAGSDHFKRTNRDLTGIDPETEESVGKLLQIAIVYEGKEIRMYRNGIQYSAYEAENVDLLSNKDNIVTFGMRHLGGFGAISGDIEDARIYREALTRKQLNSLQANVASDIKPYAWWDFEGDELCERTGKFVNYTLGEPDNTSLEDGKLKIRNWGFVIASRLFVPETPVWPEDPPEDWLTYHLAHPGPGIAEPGDPNPAYCYKGRYHLHYIYAATTGFAYAHVSSSDMVRWLWHPTKLDPVVNGHGMFSGTGFFTREGNPAMIYHGFGSGRNQLIYALDSNLDEWTKPRAIIPKNHMGEEVRMNHWDPDCWMIGDTYYALSGGKDPDLMKSDDLENWVYLGKLLHEDYPKNLGVSKDEDISCANMFKIGDKWMLLCISHRLGCRYFLGDFKDEKYLPEFHAKMNWIDTNWEEGNERMIYFAPESMLTEDGRRVMWAWIINGGNPTGIQSLPRELELPSDGILRIKPLTELQSLRKNEVVQKNFIVTQGNEHILTEIRGDAIELEINFSSPLPEEFGIRLWADEVRENGISITSGASRKSLGVADTEPPFELKDGEDLKLRVFLDKNLLEVFANHRQAAVFVRDSICENPNIRIFTEDTDLLVKEIRAWEMKSIWK